jgi:hypothetical protein
MDGKSFVNSLTRRDFSKAAAAAGAAGLTIGMGLASAGEEAAKPAAAGETPKAAEGAAKIPLRDLGKTGLKVSEISLGAMNVTDAAVVDKAIDDGCTYVDTAASYQRGENEKMVGTVMARRRNEVVLATKFSEDDKEGMFKSVNRSLERLQTDHIDTIQFHGASNANQVKAAWVKEGFDELKQQGKVRFLGFSTHENQADVLNACVETGYVDSVLVAYNAGSAAAVGDAVKNAREKGIAIVVMKSLEGAGHMKDVPAGATPHQMAIRWVLDKPCVDTVNVGMISFQQVDEDLKASQMKMSALDEFNFRRFAAAAMASQCGRCGACRGCPKGLAPVEILRAHMYAFSYGNREFAREEFVAMGGPQMVAECDNCGQCERNCPRNLNIRERFQEVARLLA